MRFVPNLIAGIAGALLVTMPAAAETRAEAGQAKLAKALEGRTAGEPVRCINLRNIRSTTIIDKTAILYDMGGGTLYVNQPEGGASSLDRDDILFTKTHGSQLCDLDLVRLVDRAGQFPRGFVNLGKFVPYQKVKVAG